MTQRPFRSDDDVALPDFLIGLFPADPQLVDVDLSKVNPVVDINAGPKPAGFCCHTRCAECGKTIPPGRAGRCCKACRGC